MNKDYIAIAKNVLQIESKSLLDASERLDDSLLKTIEIILNCRGKLIITGVGKSGLVGAKIAATLASTGTPSFFLHPTEALHGDLGMIDSRDVVLAISYSGSSSELSSILPHIKRFEIPLIAMTRDKNSTLASFADVVIDITVYKEACPLDAAPTSSTTLTMALGDAIAVCLMESRGFKKEDFASFHPGGSLGRRLFVKVSDLMRRDNLPIVDESTLLQDAIITLSEGRLGTVLLVDSDSRLTGLLSDGDIRRALMSDGFSLSKPSLEYATTEPFTIDDSSMLASEALMIIEDKKIQLLVIVDSEKRVSGVLHIHTLIEAGI